MFLGIFENKEVLGSEAISNGIFTAHTCLHDYENGQARLEGFMFASFEPNGMYEDGDVKVIMGMHVHACHLSPLWKVVAPTCLNGFEIFQRCHVILIKMCLGASPMMI